MDRSSSAAAFGSSSRALRECIENTTKPASKREADVGGFPSVALGAELGDDLVEEPARQLNTIEADLLTSVTAPDLDELHDVVVRVRDDQDRRRRVDSALAGWLVHGLADPALDVGA